MTMVAHITGGKFGKVEIPMIIFKNSRSSNSIRGVTGMQGVCYRSTPKEWMDGVTFDKWLSVPRAIRSDPHG